MLTLILVFRTTTNRLINSNLVGFTWSKVFSIFFIYIYYLNALKHRKMRKSNANLNTFEFKSNFRCFFLMLLVLFKSLVLTSSYVIFPRLFRCTQGYTLQIFTTKSAHYAKSVLACFSFHSRVYWHRFDRHRALKKSKMQYSLPRYENLCELIFQIINEENFVLSFISNM